MKRMTPTTFIFWIRKRASNSPDSDSTRQWTHSLTNLLLMRSYPPCMTCATPTFPTPPRNDYYSWKGHKMAPSIHRNLEHKRGTKKFLSFIWQGTTKEERQYIYCLRRSLERHPWEVTWGSGDWRRVYIYVLDKC